MSGIPIKIPYFVASERAGKYLASRPLSEKQILKAAEAIAKARTCKGDALTSVEHTRAFLRLKIGALPYECFMTLFLDNQHRVIDVREMFRGTIDSASVYPREVVRACIELNAAGVIFAHNHPSGACAPSDDDKRITNRLIKALGLIDVRVLDHFIACSQDCYSFAEHGLI